MIHGPALTGEIAWVGDSIHLTADTVPDQAAIIVPERGVTLSYREMRRRIDRAQAIMTQLGIRVGDRVAYLGKNSDNYYVLVFAAIRAGIVVVPLNWRCVAPEIAYFLEDSKTKLLIRDPELAALAAAALRDNPAPPIVLASEAEAESETDFRSLIAADEPATPGKIGWDGDTICLHLYTSGTTGRPKGTLCTHRALSIERHAEREFPGFPDWSGGTILSAMPNFHIGGLSWMLMGLVRRSTCILTADASAANLMRLIQAYGAASTFVVPTVVRMIVDEMRDKGIALPTLNTIFYGAAPIGRKLLADAMETLGCRFGQFFGMTEITGSATFLAPEFHDLERPQLMNSVGRAYPGVTIDIRDPDGRSMPAKGHGEIWIKTPTVMQGYWQRPDATADVLQGGWYRSGDGGYLDEQGFLYLTDRIKDMIVTGGENVYPGEVEEALRRHPAVLDAAVVGKPDERWGEAVAALIECRPDQSVSAADLSLFMRQQLAAYKCPKLIEFVDSLPRTASGKIQRSAARAALMARDASAATS